MAATSGLGSMRNAIIAITIGYAGLAAIASAAEQAPPPDAALANSGSAVYRQYCAACHGPHAEGGPNWQKRDAQGELPPPPHNSEGHTWRHSDADLYGMVSKGLRDPFNKTERLTMPGFQETLSPRQIVAVLTYLKTLWTPEERQFQFEESRGHPFPPDTR